MAGLSAFRQEIIGAEAEDGQEDESEKRTQNPHGSSYDAYTMTASRQRALSGRSQTSILLRARLRSLFVCLALACGLATASSVLAQSTAAPSPTEPAFADKEGKELRAFHVIGAAPKIDGRLDDEAWRLADTIEDFTQIDPDNMAPPTERTTVQVAYDDRYVYVAVHCFFKNPTDVATGLGRRDNIPRSDALNINFDPRHDHQTGYTFQVNASGVQGDFTFFDDNRSSFDYDGVWDAGAQVVADGWSAELRIPFSQLRFNVHPGEAAVWGFNVERRDAKTGRGEPLGADSPRRAGHRLALRPPRVQRSADAPAPHRAGAVHACQHIA